MVALLSKTAILVAGAFDQAWLCRYPRLLECVHDAGSDFTGFEFQELLQSYGIEPRPITVNNPHANSILERTHQTIANQMRSIILMSVDIKSVADKQHYIMDPVKWALNSPYRTVLQASPGQLAFGRDMIMPTSYIANWHLI
jgi:transposase InsO family protein